jgi:transcriptional regulator with XRE-family HTH domain
MDHLNSMSVGTSSDSTSIGDVKAADAGITDRLRQICRGRSAEEIGRQTGISGESVRRYLAGSEPSARFLCRLCVLEHICGTWLLTGAGAPRQQEHDETLRALPTDRIIAEIGRRVTLY